MLDCKYNILGRARRGNKIQAASTVFLVVFVLGFQVSGLGGASSPRLKMPKVECVGFRVGTQKYVLRLAKRGSPNRP